MRPRRLSGVVARPLNFTVRRRALHSWRWLLAILATAGVGAVASGYFAHGVAEVQRAAYAATAFPIYIFIYAWMKSDARVRTVETPPGAVPMIPILMPLAVPYYLIWTRRGWRKVSSLMLLSLYVLGLLATISLGEMLGRRLAS